MNTFNYKIFFYNEIAQCGDEFVGEVVAPTINDGYQDVLKMFNEQHPSIYYPSPIIYRIQLSVV